MIMKKNMWIDPNLDRCVLCFSCMMRLWWESIDRHGTEKTWISRIVMFFFCSSTACAYSVPTVDKISVFFFPLTRWMYHFRFFFRFSMLVLLFPGDPVMTLFDRTILALAFTTEHWHVLVALGTAVQSTQKQSRTCSMPLPKQKIKRYTRWWLVLLSNLSDMYPQPLRPQKGYHHEHALFLFFSIVQSSIHWR